MAEINNAEQLFKTGSTTWGKIKPADVATKLFSSYSEKLKNNNSSMLKNLRSSPSRAKAVESLKLYSQDKKANETQNTSNTNQEIDKPTYEQRIGASTLFSGLLANYGFNSTQVGELIGVAQKWINEGLDVDTIVSGIMPTTKSWQERFSGNQARLKAGLSALSPAEYMAQETAYGQALSYYGIDAAFGNRNNYAYWIGNNVSVNELSDRAKGANELVNTLDSNTLTSFQRDYGIGKGDLTAFFLDRKTGLTRLTQMAETAKLGAEAIRSNLNLGTQYREELVGAGITQGQAREAFDQVAQTGGMLSKLATISKQNTLTTRNLVDASLGLDAAASSLINQLGQLEASRFRGRNAGTASLGNNSAGSF